MTYIVIIITERNNPIIIIDIVRVLFSDFSFLMQRALWSLCSDKNVIMYKYLVRFEFKK